MTEMDASEFIRIRDRVDRETAGGLAHPDVDDLRMLLDEVLRLQQIHLPPMDVVTLRNEIERLRGEVRRAHTRETWARARDADPCACEICQEVGK